MGDLCQAVCANKVNNLMALLLKITKGNDVDRLLDESIGAFKAIVEIDYCQSLYFDKFSQCYRCQSPPVLSGGKQSILSLETCVALEQEVMALHLQNQQSLCAEQFSVVPLLCEHLQWHANQLSEVYAVGIETHEGDHHLLLLAVTGQQCFSDEDKTLMSVFANHLLLKLHTIEVQIEKELMRTGLKETQNQLVESEKMAALGRLVAGVAHELNTPIGICITALSYLQDKTADFNDAFISGALKKRDFSEFVGVSTQSTEILSANLARASELVRNFKLVAVDISHDMVRSFNLSAYLGKVLQSLYPEIKRAQHQIDITGDTTLKVKTCPGTLSQILTNLVMNSLIHAYDRGHQGHITIDICTQNEQVLLVYQDNGKGMCEQTRAMIFEPFFTTRRGDGGSGLGMHIVYNLVTQTLEGSVTCASTVGEGTTFRIVFPLTN